MRLLTLRDEDADIVVAYINITKTIAYSERNVVDVC